MEHILEKQKIIRLLKEHSINDLYYSDFVKIITESRKTKTSNKMTHDDVINYLTQKALSELETKEKLNFMLLSKIIYVMVTIITCSSEDGIQLKNETVKAVDQMIKKSKEKPIDPLNGLDQTTKKQLNILEEILVKYYLEVLEIEEPNQNETVKQLKTELYTLKQQLMEYEIKKQTYEKNRIKLEKELKKSRVTSENLKSSQQKLTTTIQSLNQELKEYKKKQLELLKSIDEKKLTITNLLSLQEEIKTLTTKIAELEQEKETLNKELDCHHLKDEQSAQEKHIREIILSQLYTQPASFERLKEILAAQGFKKSIQFINEQLNLLSDRVHIYGPSFETIPPVYKIDTNPFPAKNPFYLPISSKSELDILVIADIHKKFQAILPEEVDIAYDYATANDIQYIFNLGDNFSIQQKNHSLLTLENLKKLEEMLEDFATSFPKNTGIYLFNLGGNHDDVMLKFGLDPLQRLQQYRSDFINLGYNYAQIIFGDQTNSNNKINLHHPRVKLTESLATNPDQSTAVKDYLSKFYQKYSIDKDTIYFDFLAHVHRSKLDIVNSYCQVPSLTKDREANSAWHLKFYFDSQKNIDYIIFIPLIITNNQLKITTEIQYQKTRKIN